MARSKIDDTLVISLGAYRRRLATQIEEIIARPAILTELQDELSAVEAKLKEIDPTIPSLAEEAVAQAASPEALKMIDASAKP